MEIWSLDKQEMKLQVQVREQQICDGARTLHVILMSDLLMFLKKQEMQSLISLYGPEGKEVVSAFWDAASEYEWCKEHPVVKEACISEGRRKESDLSASVPKVVLLEATQMKGEERNQTYVLQRQKLFSCKEPYAQNS